VSFSIFNLFLWKVRKGSANFPNPAIPFSASGDTGDWNETGYKEVCQGIKQRKSEVVGSETKKKYRLKRHRYTTFPQQNQTGRYNKLYRKKCPMEQYFERSESIKKVGPTNETIQ
jgi:hypothetical protein